MFSLNFNMPKFGRRRSQPPTKDRLVTLNELPVVSLKSSRSRSIGPARMPPASRLYALDAYNDELGELEKDASLTPFIVDIEPNPSSTMHKTKRYNSLPTRLRHTSLDVTPRRGRLPRRTDSIQVLSAHEHPQSSTFYTPDYHTRYDWEPRREVSSDSRGRHIIVERSRSRQPRLAASLENREPTFRSRSRHSRSISAAPIIHLVPEDSSSQRARSVSQQSRFSEGSAYSSVSASDASSSVSKPSTAATTPSLRVRTQSSTRHAGKVEKLSTLDEPLSAASTESPRTTTTRYRYRYTPPEDDVSSIKSYVRELEKGGRRRRTKSPSDDTATQLTSEKKRYSTQSSETSTASLSTPVRGRGHGRSVSHGHISLAKTLPPIRHVRSASVSQSTVSSAPSVRPPSRTVHWQDDSPSLGASAVPTEHSSSATCSPPLGSNSSPARSTASATRPKFAERFSVCLDDPYASVAPSVIDTADTRKSDSENRRMRRVNRVLKMAEYAAGRR